MNIQDIHDIGADGPRAYAPFTPTKLQDAHDRAMEEQEPEEKPSRDEEKGESKPLSQVEEGWQAWKATNPRVEWFDDLPNPYPEIDHARWTNSDFWPK